MQDEELIRIPVNGVIRHIHIVEEKQEVYHDGVKLYESLLTRDVIFELNDGLEISLEKSDSFSEFIYLEKGYDLIDTYINLQDFENDWAADAGYVGKAARRIITLSATN